MKIENYINFLCNALLGGDPVAVDKYYATNKEEINHYAGLLHKKYPTDSKKIYRGLLLNKEDVDNKILKPKDYISYISFTESKEVALDFADTKSDMGIFFMKQCPEAEGYLIEYEPSNEEVLFHYTWAEVLGLDMYFGKESMETIKDQKEVMLKQTMKEFQLLAV